MSFLIERLQWIKIDSTVLVLQQLIKLWRSLKLGSKVAINEDVMRLLNIENPYTQGKGM